jgi:hypothetical protein
MVLADRRIGQFCAIGHVAAHAARRSRGAGSVTGETLLWLDSDGTIRRGVKAPPGVAEDEGQA